jgi:hypothetical protein
MTSKQALLAQFLFHLVVAGSHDPRIPDALNFAPHSEFTPGASHQIRDTAYDKRQQSRNSQGSEADSDTPTGSTVHQIAEE